LSLRLASLVPSVTEILFELGLGDQLVGVSHQCRYPAGARQKPALTRSRVAIGDNLGGGANADGATGAASAAIDAAYTRFRARAGSPYLLDVGLLERLAPDVIFDQGICDVCAIGDADVAAAVGSMGRAPRVVTISAATVEEIVDSVLAIGTAAGVPDRAAALVTSLRTRVAAVKIGIGRATPRPRAVCIEWLDPVWCAGHWVPELVDVAGGLDPLGQRGAPSVRLPWEAVREAAPDVLVVMPCSFSVARTLSELPVLASRQGWRDLPAVRKGRVWVAESGYFSHHSHRTIEGLEMLAHVIHPDCIPNRWPADQLVRLTRPAEGLL
jgi:iron complex transport system substrate-binding protein